MFTFHHSHCFPSFFIAWVAISIGFRDGQYEGIMIMFSLFSYHNSFIFFDLLIEVLSITKQNMHTGLSKLFVLQLHTFMRKYQNILELNIFAVSHDSIQVILWCSYKKFIEKLSALRFMTDFQSLNPQSLSFLISSGNIKLIDID